MRKLSREEVAFGLEEGKSYTLYTKDGTKHWNYGVFIRYVMKGVVATDSVAVFRHDILSISTDRLDDYAVWMLADSYYLVED
jgi:hypothetical protein